LKSLKGYTRSSLLHRDAYLAFLRLVQVTDDTVSVHKSLVNEILTTPKKDATTDNQEEEEEAVSPLLEIALNENGSKIFLLLLVQDDEARMKYFDPYERTVLEPEPTVVENGKEVPTYKKSQQARRQEMLQYLKQGLIELCANHADELIQSLPGSRVLKEVYAVLTPEEVVTATIEVCVSALDKTSDDVFSLFEDPIGHRVVKNMILSDVENDKATFSNAFVEELGDRLMEVAASNRGAFVVAALCKVPAVRVKVLLKLKSANKKLTQLSKGKEGATAGYAALLKEMSS
jgi:pumilio family protein 6